MKKRGSLAPFLVLALLFAAVWMYFTPYLALRKLQSAAERGDREALNELVDFPALRQSVKTSVSTAVSREIGSDGNPFAALGGMVAGALAGPVVDAFVTPQGIAALTHGRRPDQDGDGDSDEVRVKGIDTKRGYEGVDRFIVRFVDEKSGDDRVALVMERAGIVGWKLVGVRLLGDRKN